MAIKKKVTYSVSYTAGTDTLTTKLNSLLQDIVALILSQNTGLAILDTITVGSARWTGAPLYDTYVYGLRSYDFQDRHYESDVYFLGTNEDNVCLSLGFFDGNFIIAMNMTPKVEKEYTDNWAAMGGGSNVPLYAIGRQSRFFGLVDAMIGNYAIPYTVANGTISMGIIYWNDEYSRGYSFVNGSGQSDGVNLIIFPTDEGSNVTGLGCAIRPFGAINAYRNGLYTIINVFSFGENLSNNKPDTLDSTYINYPGPIPSAASMQLLNSRYDWRSWGKVRNDEGNNALSDKYFQALHSFGGRMGLQAPLNYYHAAPQDMPRVNVTWDITQPRYSDSSASSDNFLSPLLMPYNLPHLNPGQAYVRKMRIPGWNPNCKGEIYLLWSPVVSAYQSGDIVEVGSKSYAIITEGAICWAARVS